MSVRLITRVFVVVGTLALAGCLSEGGRDVAPPAADTGTPTRAPVVPPTADAPAGAAIRFVASTDALMGRSPVGRREILRRLVSPSTFDEQAAALESAIAEMAEKLDVPVERLVWVEAPLTAYVTRTGPASASVDVWTVSILGAPTLGSPQQVWRTVHVDVVLVDGRWLVESANADAGPTPASNELALQAGWDEFETVASWPAALPGADL